MKVFTKEHRFEFDAKNHVKQIEERGGEVRIFYYRQDGKIIKWKLEYWFDLPPYEQEIQEDMEGLELKNVNLPSWNGARQKMAKNITKKYKGWTQKYGIEDERTLLGLKMMDWMKKWGYV